MKVIGYDKYGYILIEVDGEELYIPDDLENRHRIMIHNWEEKGNVIPPYIPEPEPVKIPVVDAVAFWERMTNEEADKVRAAIETQPFRSQMIFNKASSFRGDHELWVVLEQIAVALFGLSRAGEILEPTHYV